ncbi:MAG: hypothetical protein N2Z74_07020 [Syntrophales bacterium]|nr:hypothetical protein [Syntrophales bacterium]
METPFLRSYWVVPGRFLAGYYPGDRKWEMMEQKLSALLACGIRCIINLMEPEERDHEGRLFVDYKTVLPRLTGHGVTVECHRLPIRDLGIPASDLMVRILDVIDDAVSQGHPVYVHCWGGRGRTGTVVGCWLARHGIASGEEALEKIQALRAGDPTASWPSPETFEQIRMVTSWQKGQ